MLPCPAESEERMLNRFCVARKWVLDDTIEMIRNNIRFRHDEGVLEMRRQPADAALGCPEKDLLQCLPLWTEPSKRDALGRPIVVFAFGRLKIKQLLKLTDLDRLKTYLCWRQERTCIMCGHVGNSADFANLPCAQTMCIFDLRGFSLKKHAGSEARAIAAALISQAADYYPETVTPSSNVACCHTGAPARAPCVTLPPPADVPSRRLNAPPPPAADSRPGRSSCSTRLRFSKACSRS